MEAESNRESQIAVLTAEIRKSRNVLQRIEDFYDEYTGGAEPAPSLSREQKIVIAEILTNYYTCLETIFLRISQFFENNLTDDRWHHDLLDKMILSIDGVRPAVISEETHAALRELMRFRHFKRYYLEFDYDPDKLVFLTRKFMFARGRVGEELDGFAAMLSGG